MSPLHIGDVVQVGKGRMLWRILGFWGDNFHLAQLQNVDREWVRTSSPVDKLTRVEHQP